MDFGFTEAQEKLRQEITEFFMNELPEDYEYAITNFPGREPQAFLMALKDKAVQKGYYVPGWPKEYGGSGGVGAVIPPVAMCVFIVKNITNVPAGTIYKGVYPFLIALCALAALLFICPQIATFLPNLLMK